MPIGIASIAGASADNPSGTRQVIYVAFEEDFTTIQKPLGDAGNANDDLVAIKTDHVFKQGKCFHRIEVEINKNELNAEQQGAVKGGHQKQNFSGFVSNLNPTISGTLKLLKRKPVITLVPLPDGQVLQIGQKDNGGHLSYNDQTGLAEGGERGNAITIMAYHDKQFYTGAILLTPAP